MEQSKILVARSANRGFIKVVGRGSFQNSGCLKAFYQQLLKEGVNRFVVDLETCSYLDSTFLGILLGLGLKLKDTSNGLLQILNASLRNLELLKNLGLDRLISIDGKASLLSNGISEGSGSPENNNGLSGSGGPLGTNGHGNGHGLSSARVELKAVEQNLEEMACPVPTRQEAAPTILEAHEALMDFDPRNVPKFKDVVEFLREDLGQNGDK